jgi:flavodoxin
MHVVIVYETSTGTTAKAAEAMGRQFLAQGHRCDVLSVSKADPAEVVKADLICIGGWVHGFFVVGQHPSGGALKFIARLGNLSGKQVAVFCTYKIAAGSTLRQLAEPLEQKGATVAGRFQFRGPTPDAGFARFAQTVRPPILA